MLANGPSFRLLPRLDESTTFYWHSGEDEKLRILHCNNCGFYIHPPGPICPRCLSRDVAPKVMSGRGRVETFTINYQQWIPGSEPYAIAWVSLNEQPSVRLTANLIEVDVDDITIGMEVEVTFEHLEDVYLPLFRPVKESNAQ